MEVFISALGSELEGERRCKIDSGILCKIWRFYVDLLEL
jgi:hypothetical protein